MIFRILRHLWTAAWPRRTLLGVGILWGAWWIARAILLLPEARQPGMVIAVVVIGLTVLVLTANDEREGP